MSAGLFLTPTEQHLPGWVGGGGDIVEPNPRDRRSVVKKKQNSWHFLSKIVGAKLRKTQ